MLKKNFLILVFIFLVFNVLIFAEKADIKADIIVKITGFKNNKGYARALLFREEEGFPANHKKAYKIGETVIMGDEAEIIFEDINYGEYAVSVLHDENNNKKMDANFFGKPKESVGVSNNIRPIFLRPSFDGAKFNVTGSRVFINVELR